MKHIYITITGILFLMLFSCTEFLQEKHETTDTAASLAGSATGLDKMCVALYNQERNLSTTDAQLLAANLWVERTTDLVVFQTGGDANLGWFKSVGPSSNIQGHIYNPFWVNRYYIIGRANEIIYYGKQLGEEATKQVAEGSFWRAYAYYQLFCRFGKVFIDSTIITNENVNNVIPTVAPEADVYALMLSDIDVAIKDLPRIENTGRVSKNTARHLKALICAWKHDWEGVLDAVHQIDTSGVHKMNTDPSKIFATRDYSKNSETLFSLNFSRDRGGKGHRQGSMHITQAAEIKYTHAMVNGKLEKFNSTNLGNNWGVAFPNTYLMSLYTAGDKRLDVFFKRHMTIENPNEISKGLVIPEAVTKIDPKTGKTYYTTSNRTTSPITLKQGDIIAGRDVAVLDSTLDRAFRRMCVSSLKHFDELKPLSGDGHTLAGKDIMIYRLAETYLLGAEAAVYLNKQDLAKTYYNKTWVRAGNTAITGNVTFDMVAAEQARELNFEGRRWEFLKRNGIWYEQIYKYAGDFTHYPTLLSVYDPATYGNEDGIKRDKAFGPNPDYYIDFSGGSNDHVITRINVRPHYVNWPIPQTQIEAMEKDGGIFPQNDGY